MRTFIHAHKNQAERIEDMIWQNDKIRASVKIDVENAGGDPLKAFVTIRAASFADYVLAKRTAMKFGFDKLKFHFLPT